MWGGKKETGEFGRKPRRCKKRFFGNNRGADVTFRLFRLMLSAQEVRDGIRGHHDAFGWVGRV